MITLSQEEMKAKIDAVNWNFKVGDNIKHNIEEVFYLYVLKESSCSNIKEKQFLNKHISITLVGIIEAILYDFVVRLNDATNQFPLIINTEKRSKIKKYIAKQKVPHIGEKYYKVRNYTFLQILALLREFELLEQKDSPIYNTLENAVYFRNRIHIYNWFNNFEKDEKHVFTDKRLQTLEQLVVYILTTMEAKYSRP